MKRNVKWLVLSALILSFFVVLKGAYTRLVDAGLGCPDWPGCYGHVLPPETDEKVKAANAIYPERPVEAEKAWPEMIHRYMASFLGMLIITIAFLGWKQRNNGFPYILAIALVPIVIFQGLLGKWTVTMGLYPPIVMGHLLGGFTTVSLLAVIAFKLFFPSERRAPEAKEQRERSTKTSFLLSLLGVIVLFGQISLGGWTSANYAALVCTDLPVCQSGWQESLNFAEAFSVGEPRDGHYEFGVLGSEARVTIHVLHRFGALVASFVVLLLALSLVRNRQPLFQRFGWGLVIVLSAQVILGISNVVFHLPLAVAVAHNGVALLLLILMVITIHQLRHHSRTE